MKTINEITELMKAFYLERKGSTYYDLDAIIEDAFNEGIKNEKANHLIKVSLENGSHKMGEHLFPQIPLKGEMILVSSHESYNFIVTGVTHVILEDGVYSKTIVSVKAVDQLDEEEQTL
jgi:hypothetical protein